MRIFSVVSGRVLFGRERVVMDFVLRALYILRNSGSEASIKGRGRSRRTRESSIMYSFGLLLGWGFQGQNTVDPEPSSYSLCLLLCCFFFLLFFLFLLEILSSAVDFVVSLSLVPSAVEQIQMSTSN